MTRVAMTNLVGYKPLAANHLSVHIASLSIPLVPRLLLERSISAQTINMETAVATPLTTKVTLDSLPAEIITSIADHLRSMPHVREDYTPRLAAPCKCTQVTPLKFAKAQLQSLGYFQDEALAFGMTCRRLREIAFLERLRRAVSVQLCLEAGKNRAHMPERLLSHVRYVWYIVNCRIPIRNIRRTLRIAADPTHVRSWADLNFPLERYPNIDKLIVNWRLLLHDTEDRLLEPQDFYADPPVRELEIYVGSKSTGIIDSGGEPQRLFSAIIKETEDVVTNLHLPVLESLFLRIDINEPLPEDEVEWDLLAECIKMRKWKKTLKRVDLVISFDLGDEPDTEVPDVSPLFKESRKTLTLCLLFSEKGLELLACWLPEIVAQGAADVRMTLNFFFPPKDYRSDVITRLSLTRLRHRNIGHFDPDSLVDEEKMRKTTQYVAYYPTLEKLEVRVTGSTSNGWQHHERTLATVSYTKPDGYVAPTATNDDPVHVTFTRNTQGAQEICGIINDIVQQNAEGVPREEMQARAEWMALRGMVEQSHVTGREAEGW
jgi:hypothetical protein